MRQLPPYRYHTIDSHIDIGYAEAETLTNANVGEANDGAPGKLSLGVAMATIPITPTVGLSTELRRNLLKSA